MNNLSFEQGVVVGLIVGNFFKNHFSAEIFLRKAGNLDLSAEGQRLLEKIIHETQQPIPGFPNGIPEEAIYAADAIIKTLLMSKAANLLSHKAGVI